MDITDTKSLISIPSIDNMSMTTRELSEDPTQYYFANDPRDTGPTRLPPLRKEVVPAVSPSKSMEFTYNRQPPSQNLVYHVLPGSSSISDYSTLPPISNKDKENVPKPVARTSGRSDILGANIPPPLPPHPIAGVLTENTGPMHAANYPANQAQVNEDFDDFMKEKEYESLSTPVAKFPPGNTYSREMGRMSSNNPDNTFVHAVNDKDYFGDTDSIVQKIHVTKKNRQHNYIVPLLCVWMLLLTIITILIGISSVAALVRSSGKYLLLLSYIFNHY